MDDVIIPGLPNDVARRCLIHLSYDELANAAKVSRRWTAEIEHPLFHLERRAMRMTQSIIVVMDAIRYMTKKKSYGICVGTELVVLGGRDSESGNFLDSVFNFNFISGQWRHGARIPGPPRLCFGCASDSQRKIYVAGGYHKTRQACKNLMAYDVVEDKWTILPDMAKARIWCRILFHREKLHVIEDNRYVEVFDVGKSTWDSVSCNESDVMSGLYVNDGDGVIYTFGYDKVMLLKGIDWQVVLAKIPVKFGKVFFVTIWQRKLILFVRIEDDDSVQVHEMDLDNYSWKTIGTVPDRAHWVQSGCYLEI